MGGRYHRRAFLKRRRNHDAGPRSEPEPFARHRVRALRPASARHRARSLGPSPSPSPGTSPSPSPSPQPSCNPIANASMTIAGGGGPFNPTSLTINAATRVTWTNVGNNRARVRDVNHDFLDSDDLEPGQSYSFTFCVPGTYQIEDHRGSATATIVVTGRPARTSPSPHRTASPFASTEPERFTEPNRHRRARSPSPSQVASPSPSRLHRERAHRLHRERAHRPSPGTSPSPSPGRAFTEPIAFTGTEPIALTEREPSPSPSLTGQAHRRALPRSRLISRLASEWKLAKAS